MLIIIILCLKSQDRIMRLSSYKFAQLIASSSLISSILFNRFGQTRNKTV